MFKEQGFDDNWLLPAGEQDAQMRQWCGQKRFVWNRALAMEQARFRRKEELLGSKRMMRELTQWREKGRDTEFLREAPVHALQCVRWELYDAYDRFFKENAPKNKALRRLLRKQGIPLAYPPTFKKKFASKLSFTESDPACFELNQQDGRLKLSKIGWVKCRYPREIVGKPNSITVKFDGRRCQNEAYTSQECPRRSYTATETQASFACVNCGFQTSADNVGATSQLKKFLSSDKGVALLASGYRASANSLGSGQSWDSASNKESAEALRALCA